jgi:hypothetical protein
MQLLQGGPQVASTAFSKQKVNDFHSDGYLENEKAMHLAHAAAVFLVLRLQELSWGVTWPSKVAR